MTRGDYMKAARVAAGMTLRELGAIAGIPYNTINRLEIGTRQGRIDTIEVLADALGLSIDEYVGHERKKKT